MQQSKITDTLETYQRLSPIPRKAPREPDSVERTLVKPVLTLHLALTSYEAPSNGATSSAGSSGTRRLTTLP